MVTKKDYLFGSLDLRSDATAASSYLDPLHDGKLLGDVPLDLHLQQSDFGSSNSEAVFLLCEPLKEGDKGGNTKKKNPEKMWPRGGGALVVGPLKNFHCGFPYAWIKVMSPSQGCRSRDCQDPDPTSVIKKSRPDHRKNNGYESNLYPPEWIPKSNFLNQNQLLCSCNYQPMKLKIFDFRFPIA